ncbi:hypothetical protein pSal_SNUABM02_113 [Salmonella phage pSal-SNUABM-02]|jgi:hypothetical protein|nr:hypothetical protein pSal_SNUABM02_113 [Salmonella phage pSal-SNUABM-02]
MQVEDIKETRDGRRVRIICIDAKIGGGVYNTVGLVKEPDGTDFIEWWNITEMTEDGLVRGSGDGSLDLKL